MVEERRVPVCPQCGSHKIMERWVKREKKPKIVEVPLDNWAEESVKRRRGLYNMAGDIHMPQLSDYSQLVLECQDCGFTKVYPIAEH